MRNAIQLAVKHDLFGLQTAHDFTANISTSFPGSLAGGVRTTLRGIMGSRIWQKT
jgi:hypothetical protein